MTGRGSCGPDSGDIMKQIPNPVHTVNGPECFKRDVFVLETAESFKSCSLFSEEYWKYKEYVKGRKYFDLEAICDFALRNVGMIQMFLCILSNILQAFIF
jgi:hypothetical protein